MLIYLDYPFYWIYICVFQTNKHFKKMNKYTKRKYDGVAAQVREQVARQFGVTSEYVRMCVSGKITYGRYDEIKRAYHEKYAEVQKVLSAQLTITNH